MTNEYTAEAAGALAKAASVAGSCRQSDIGTEHLLAGLLKETDGTAAAVLMDNGIMPDKLLTLIDQLITPGGTAAIKDRAEYTPRARAVLEKAKSVAARFGSELVGTEHILIALLLDTESVATRLLHTMEADIAKIYADTVAAVGAEIDITDKDIMSGNIFKGEAAATPALDEFSRDLTAQAARGELDPVVGRDAEIMRVIRILSRRTKNNPCLVGEPGVGKTAIVEGLAQRIAWDAVPASVKGRRVLVLDLAGMVAGSKYRGEFEERIKKVVREVAQNKNIILFVDELHTLIGAGGAEGALDASNILKPSLSRGEIQMIGATTIDEYRKHIEKDAALERRFQPVQVEEPSREETIAILKGLRPHYEKHHGARITDEAIQAAVDLSERYINDRRLPDKAIDLLDEAGARVSLGSYKALAALASEMQSLRELSGRKEAAIVSGRMDEAREISALQKEMTASLEKSRAAVEGADARRTLIVDEDSVAAITAEWTGIPVTRLAESESKRLSRLESRLHKRVIGQDEAVKAVASAIKRGRVGLKNPNRPIGSFLFLGPTGVGKTELSKAVAATVFGSEESMIRVDMSEYMEKYSVSKMIGSPPGYVGYDEGGQLSEQVRRHPYSVVLFDEIEKAHPDVFNIMLQILDEGHITDAHGRRVDFKNACIIMTSNAGAQSIVDPKRLGFGARGDAQKDYERMKDGVMAEVRRIFRPEFINRIDEIIVFHTLGMKEVEKVAGLMAAELQTRAKKELDIDLKITASARKYIAEKGYSEKYGARPLRRVIQEKIENPLTDLILNGEITRGSSVTVRIDKRELTIS